MSSHVRKLVRLVPVGLAVVLMLASCQTASAQIACFQNLENCFYRAAQRDSFADRTLAGLDCELEFADCARRALIGR